MSETETGTSSSDTIRLRLRRFYTWLDGALSSILRIATQPAADGWPKWTWRALLLGAYAGGAAALYYTLNGGAIQLNLHDWAEVTAPRYAFLKDAVTRGQLPLHMPGEWALRNVTDRFIAVADTNLSPQVLLLRYLDIGRFLLVNTLFLYSLGFIGLVLLARRLQLSPLAFGLLFALLFFNGHIIDHLVVGHVNWAANFLFPFFGYLLLRRVEGRRTSSWAAMMALFLFALLLQGAFHFFVACLLFLGLLWLVSPPDRRPIFLAGLLTAGVGAVRLLPPLLELREFDTAFLSGYPTVLDLASALVTLKPPISEFVFFQSGLTNLDWWEFDLYVGLAGAVFMAWFGFSSFVQRESTHMNTRILGLPLLIVGALAIGKIYKLFHVLQIPLLSSQRVSSRLIFVPFALLAILAARSFQQWLSDPDRSRSGRVAVLAGSLLIANDLWQHTKLWRVVNMGRLFPPKDLDLSLNVVANHPDPAYHLLLAIGGLISTASLVILFWILWRSRAKRIPSAGPPTGSHDPR